MGPEISFRRFRGEPSPESGSPFWGDHFRSTPISRFCHRDSTSDVTSPGAVSRFWASTTVIPQPEPENRRALTSSTDFCNTTTMRGHLLATASIPRACFWSVPGHVASGRFRIVRSCEQCTDFVLPKSATGRDSPSRGCFPIGNARAPTQRISNTPWSPFRAYVALEKLVAFRKGRRPIRQRRSAKNYRLETHRRYRR